MSRSKLTVEEFIRRAKEIHGDKYSYDRVKDFKNVTEKVEIYCKKCKKYFWQRVSSHIYIKSGHPHRGYTVKVTLEEFIKRATQIHNGKYSYDRVKILEKTHSKIEIYCKKCKKYFIQRADDHLYHKRGCEYCVKMSSLEKSLRDFLIKNNINFDYEKRFDWLKYKGPMRLDFYLPDYNVAIECQGLQHFNNLGNLYRGDTFINRIKKDDHKFNLCKEHNIKLLYFSDENNYDISWNKYKVYLDKEELITEIKNNIDKS